MTITSLVVVALLGGSPEPPLEVCLNNLAIVDQAAITLGDVARIDSDNPEVIAALASIPLAAAPEPAHAMVIQKEDMRLLLVRHGIDPRRVHLEGADTVQVVREGRIVEAREILGAIREYVRDATRWNDEDFAFDRLWGIHEVSIPSGTYEIDVQLLSEQISTDPRFRVKVSQDGGEAHSMIVSLRLCRFVDAFASRRAIERGEAIAPEDLEPIRIDQNSMTSRQVSRLIGSPEATAGQVARCSIPAGHPLTEDMLVTPAVIDRGERVLIRIERGAVRITGPGIAKQSGRLGETLQVHNLATGKYIYARVTSPGIVTLD